MQRLDDIYRHILYGDGEVSDLGRVLNTYMYYFLKRLNALYALSRVGGVSKDISMDSSELIMKEVIDKVLGNAGFELVCTENIMDELALYSGGVDWFSDTNPQGVTEYLKELGVSFEGYLEFVRKRAFDNIPIELIKDLIANPYIDSLNKLVIYRGKRDLYGVDGLNYLSEGFDCPLAEVYFEGDNVFLVLFEYDVSSGHYAMTTNIYEWCNVDNLIQCVS